MCRVFSRLESDDILWIAAFDDLVQAKQFIESLNTHWSRQYLVRDSAGNDVDLDEVE